MAGLNTLKRTGARASRRVGRGQSSGAGKTSGRGTKGQNARAGRKKRPELRDLIKKLPKRRGFGKNRGRTVFALRPKPVAVTLRQIVLAFDVGSEITPAAIISRGIVPAVKGRAPMVKIVGQSEEIKKFTFKNVTVSAGAKKQIESAGGSIS